MTSKKIQAGRSGQAQAVEGGRNPSLSAMGVEMETANPRWTKTQPKEADLMEAVVSPANMQRAYKRVCGNKGSAGVDGIDVAGFKAHLERHWPTVKAKLLVGEYIPAPVRRVDITKPQGGVRTLGIPTLLDRLIQQALHQVLSEIFEPEFSEFRTRIAYAAGLRAHELLTIRRKSEQPASSHRKWSNKRFAGRNGEAYTVIGKGGLIREIRLPGHLARALEDVRLAEPTIVVDRNIKYRKHYDLTGGVYFSLIFGKTSKAVLGWSTGAHGLRHGYAQDRMSELLDLGFTRAERMAVISQELGHFRPDIVSEYLR